MGKTILYVVLLVVLGFGVWYFLFREKEAFSGNEVGFQIKDTAAIGKIYLADKSGNTVLLERRNDAWYLNDSFKAMEAPVNTLLATLAAQEAAYPVAENMHNTVVKSLSATGIKVEVYNKSDGKLGVFYVGGQASNNAGTFMLMDGAEKPYVVQIPGFPGYLTPRYSTSAKDWRDRTVFDVSPADLQMVSIRYATDTLNNFTLYRDASGRLAVNADSALIRNNVLNERRTSVYTKFFENVYCEGYLNGVPDMRSVISTTAKRCIIDVAAKNGRKQHVEIYWKPISKRSKNQDVIDPDVPGEYDSDRFYAVMNNFKDTVLIQRYAFDKIFRRAFEFYQPDAQPANMPDTVFSNTVQMNVE